MKKISDIMRSILTVTAVLIGVFAISNRPVHAASNHHKVLVVYFSQTKGVYGGDLKKVILPR